MTRHFPIIGLFCLLSLAFVAGLLWRPPVDTAEMRALLDSAVPNELTFESAYPTEIPDFSALPAGSQRKQAFFNFMTPIVRAENQAILSQRRVLEELIRTGEMGWSDPLWLERLAQRYEMKDFKSTNPDHWQALKKRVDKVPVSMALAQAANESAWGTSRFARQGNNYFGQWCFSKGCGLVPSSRTSGAEHEVEVYDSPRESVRRYMNNINTHSAYQSLRKIRTQLRQAGQEITGLKLAEGLLRYSERGQAYVDELKAMIRGNDLDTLD